MYGPPWYTSPPDPDDRWEAIAERLESEYATGDKLREIAESEFEELDITAELVAIYDGHIADIPAASERLVRSLLSRLSDAIEKTAREDAEAEVARMDDEAADARGEAAYWSREDAA